MCGGIALAAGSAVHMAGWPAGSRLSGVIRTHGEICCHTTTVAVDTVVVMSQCTHTANDDSFLLRPAPVSPAFA